MTFKRISPAAWTVLFATALGAFDLGALKPAVTPFDSGGFEWGKASVVVAAPTHTLRGISG